MEENKNTQATMAQNYSIPISIVIAGIAIALAIYFGKTNPPQVAQAKPRVQVEVDSVTNTDHILGNPNAKIVIVEYSDTECPFCKTFHETMSKIMNEYGERGDVAWVYRHFPLPFHTKAPKEAEATECANKIGGNTKFWEYLNTIFAITPANNGLDLAELPKVAVELGLDEKVFNDCLSSGEMSKIVDAGLASGHKAGVSGTPYSALIVNGKKVSEISGAQPYEVVKAEIELLLKNK